MSATVARKNLRDYLDMVEDLRMESTVESGPNDFNDSEIIKAKLEALDAKLDKIIGRLEALQASLDDLPQGN